MTRVLTITSWYPPHHFGGYELSCFDVMTRFAARGHDVRVLCGDEEVRGAALRDHAHERLVHRELRPHLRERDHVRPRPSVRERIAIERHNHAVLDRHLREHKPDVVSVWHMVAISMSLVRRLAEQPVPVVHVVCDNWPLYGEQVDPWMAPFTGGVLRSAAGRVVERATGLPTSAGDFADRGSFCFVSEWTRDRVVRERPWSYGRSTVVYSGIERADFPEPTAMASHEPGWQLLYVGRLDRWKGVDTLLAAMPLLPAASLRCYGRGAVAERARLTALASQLGVSDRVHFGSLERDELAARYAAADVAVFPSEWDEPFGLVPLEAMACGTPVVATGVGGSGEFLRDGYNCALFPAGDAAALAAAVQRVHDDAALRRTLVQGGLRTARELDVDRLADALEAWHLAAADGFAHGQPPSRALAVPPRARDAAIEAPGAEPMCELVATLLARSIGTVLVGADARVPISPLPTAHRSLVQLVERDAGTRRSDGVLPVVAAPERLPFRAGTFDAAALCCYFEAADDDRAAVAEVARVVRSQAPVVVTTRNRRDVFVSRVRWINRIRALHAPPTAYVRSAPELESMLATDFTVRARHAVGWGGGGRMRRIVSACVTLPVVRRYSAGTVFELERRK